MSFIGNAPAAIPTSFQAVQADSFNGNGSTTNFTLSRQITNLYDIEVLVDNVQQSPYDGSYSVSGTTLTFSSAPSSGTNNIYVIYRDHPITSIAPVGNLNVDGDVSVSGTTKTNAIVDYSGGTTATINGYTPTASNMAGRNRIINGAMMIDQRNAGASVTPTDGQFSVDRWAARLGQASKYSIQQNAGSVTPPAGFVNYLGVTSLSAYSLIASDYFAIQQGVEGFNLADFGWGTANAKTVTLSFWVRSSLTGTFGGCFQNRLSNRSYPFSYTISSANTWEQKSVTVVGDTTGTWDTNNVGGVYLFFALGMGSNREGTANTWNSGNYLGVPGATSVVGTSGATFYLTGVQLEVGSSATEFEHRLYGQELALCQRYFWKLVGSSGSGYPLVGVGQVGSLTSAYIGIPTPVTMRSTPDLSYTGTVTIYDASSAGSLTSLSTIYPGGTNYACWAIFVASSGAFTTGRSALMYLANSSSNSFSLSAEL